MDPEGTTSHLTKHGEKRRRIEMDDMENEPPIVVCCTGASVVRASQEPETLMSRDKTFETQNEMFEVGDAGDNEEKHARVLEVARTRQNKFQVWTFVCGLLVGGFIQLSSLGSNYMLLELYDDPDNTANLKDPKEDIDSLRSFVLTFSLLWSVVTSLMGVAVLLLVRALVLMQGSKNPDFKKKESRDTPHVTSLPVWLTYLECSFAVGTLMGLCIVCIFTDYLLGCSAHFGHSFMTLACAMLWSKLLLSCADLAKDVAAQNANKGGEADSRTESEDDLIKPLLGSGNGASSGQTSFKAVTFSFRFTCLLLGLIIGFFTQLSSLGANFLLAHWQVPRENHSVVFWTSLAWAMITALMGILVMVFVRGVIVITSSDSSSDETTCTDSFEKNESKLTAYINNVILNLECSFAIGALLGVNLAWLFTDLMLGMTLHLTHSLISLSVAFVWCQSVVSYVTYNRRKQRKQASQGQVKKENNEILVV